MDGFCRKCGSPLNGAGACPRCGGANGKTAEKTEKDKKKSHTLTAVLIAAGVVALAAVVLIIVLSGKKKDEGPRIIPEEIMEPVDSEQYVSEQGTVLSRTAFDSANGIMTEAEAVRFFKDRGFTQSPAVYYEQMDGSFCDETEADETSSEKHPEYMTSYVTESGAVWGISVVNGRVYANPVTFNYQGYWYVPHTVSETENLLLCDTSSRLFYEVSPYSSSTVLKIVPRIDAAALEQLTVWEVGE